jgi:hopanoid biosynthesis associated radical SAM protein HpnH
MPVPVRQSARIGWYLARQKLARREKFPLIVELEPLFQCNLACPGCGKIQQPEPLLRQRMPVAQAVDAVMECGAPMVSIAGGEPLIHPEIHTIARELIARKRFVYLCTNALLLEKKMANFTPSPYFSWVVHMDGLREAHDRAVDRDGVFDKAVQAIRAAKQAGFRVTTNTTVFSTDSPSTVEQVLNFLNDELRVDQMMIAPAYAYEKAPDQEHFLGVRQTRELFGKAFSGGSRKRWRLNHTPLYLDFLEQDRDGVHRLGHPQLLTARLAAALLPDVRRLRADLQGADREHRMGEVWTRQGSSLRKLHGPLRLRALRGDRDHRLAAPVAAGDGQPVASACASTRSM